jgi:hypothetical protein
MNSRGISFEQRAATRRRRPLRLLRGGSGGGVAGPTAPTEHSAPAGRDTALSFATPAPAGHGTAMPLPTPAPTGHGTAAPFATPGTAQVVAVGPARLDAATTAPGPGSASDVLTVHENPARRRRAAAQRARILVAAADAKRRAAVLRELSESLPQDTPFGEASAAREVFEQASTSGVVMLAGDLGEVSAESLMHTLGHRHPSLPVVALGLGTPPAQSASA